MSKKKRGILVREKNNFIFIYLTMNECDECNESNNSAIHYCS